MTTQRILVVDDHPLIRQGIARILANALPNVSVTDAAGGDEAVRALAAQPCDLVTLDLTLPGEHGLDVLRRIKAIARDVPVLVVSMHEPELFAARALLGGASGYVTKSSAPEELVRAAAALLAGERWAPDTLDRSAAPAPHDALSDREYQVLRLIGQGRTVTEIAGTLSLSVKTVSTYRTRVLEKLNLHSTAEIIHYAVSHRLT